MLVILIRSDNIADVAITITLRLGTARPEPARLEENLGPSVEEEVYILGCLPVLPDRVRDIGSNVLFLLPAQDIDDLAVRTNNLLRCRLRTGIRGPSDPPSLHSCREVYGRRRPTTPKAARLVGIRVDNVYMYTFGIGAAVAAISAVLMAPLTLLNPDMGFSLFIKGSAAAVLGGLTSIPGAILGAAILGLAGAIGGQGYVNPGLQEVAAFIIILLVMIFIPTGILGEGSGYGRV